MAKPQLRKPSCFKSVSFVRTCNESLSRNFADSLAESFQSLTLNSWSLPIDSLNLHSLSDTRDSLTLPSLSLIRDRFHSLTLQSLSLIDENRFQRISFRDDSFEDGSLKEPDKSLAHTLAEKESWDEQLLQHKLSRKDACTRS